MTVTYHDYSFISLISRSYYLNQHFFLGYSSKISFLDILYIKSNLNVYNSSILNVYNYFILDLYLSFNIQYLMNLSYFTSTNQDCLILVLLFSPETIISMSDYFYNYYFGYTSTISVTTSCFDSYLNNLDYNFNDGVMFFFFIFFIFLIYYLFFLYGIYITLI